MKHLIDKYYPLNTLYKIANSFIANFFVRDIFKLSIMCSERLKFNKIRKVLGLGLGTGYKLTSIKTRLQDIVDTCLIR